MEFFKLKRKNSGITLIALVITIIVLLILAGVSIAMLTGQNGILTQAQNSKTTSELKSAEEKVKLAIMAARSQSETGALDADKLIAEITNNYGGTASKTNNGFPLNITIDEKNFIIDDDGNVMKKELIAADIANATQKEKQNIYGATVTGYTLPSGTTTDVGWKIFYADKSNIYLIASDYVERENLPYSTTETGETTTRKTSFSDSSHERSGYFANILGDYAGSARITDSRLKVLNNDYFNTKNYSSNNNNMKSVAYMMDTTAWNSKFLDSGKAEYTIGGPTIELLFKSYNEKYGTSYVAGATSAVGYSIKKQESDSWSPYIKGMLTKNDNTQDSLYVISNNSKAYGMWLASPSADNAEYAMNVNYAGYVNDIDYYVGSYGFRPLVCLKSNVQLQKAADSTYKLK